MYYDISESSSLNRFVQFKSYMKFTPTENNIYICTTGNFYISLFEVPFVA